MEEHEATKPLVAVTNLREFFHDSVQAALRKQRVDVDDHTEHYVVNILTMFARSEELYERDARRRPPQAARAHARRRRRGSVRAAARRSAAPPRRRLAVRRRILRAELRAQADRHRLSHRDGRPRLRHARRQPARHAARPGVRHGVPRARAEIPAPGRRAQRGRGDGAHAHRPGHPAAVRDLAEDRQPARVSRSCSDSAWRPSRRARARSTDVQLLRQMQTLLAQLYDAPVDEDVQDFVRQRPAAPVPKSSASRPGSAGDEQVFVVEEDAGRAARPVHRARSAGAARATRSAAKRSTKTTCRTTARRSKA